MKAKSFLRTVEWQDLRNAALERDTNQCCLCHVDLNLVVHHILYRKGNKLLQADLDNLVTVCKKCHWLIHRGTMNFNLMQWLRYNRPRQYLYLLDHINDALSNQ